MTFSTPSSVSLVSPFTPLSQLASTSPRDLLDTVSHMFSSSCQLDILQYLTDSSGVLGTSALHLFTIVIEMFSPLIFCLSKPVCSTS